MQKKNKSNGEPPKGLLEKISLYFFRRPWRTALLTIAIMAYGTLCFTSYMQREGFPAMNIPYAVGQIGYVVGDPAKVDAEVAKPLSEYVLKQDGVKNIKVTSADNYAFFTLQYTDGIDAETRTKTIFEQAKQDKVLPDSAQLKADAAKMGFTQRGDDVVVSFYNHQNINATTQSLLSPAMGAVQFFKDKNLTLVEEVSLLEPIETLQNPITGESLRTQTKFERYGVFEKGGPKFYHALAIGFIAKDDTDKLKLDTQIDEAVKEYNLKNSSSSYRMAISASYAPLISQQISELQRTLLEGLIAVLLVGTIIITFRSSLITVVSMIAVILATFGVLHLIGYTLNTIVLFTLILGLAMIVDDTIIVVEAIDKERRRGTAPDKIVGTAVRKVGRAMVAATTTAALSFAPLLFVGGVIGQFVRAVPITIIIALLTSLVVALVLIPFLARFIMLRPKQLGHTKKKHERAAEIEAAIARKLSAPMLWARHSRAKEIFVGLFAVLVSLMFVFGGVYLATKVKFNIFPATKDTNEIALNLSFPEGTDIASAEKITDKVTVIIGETLGDNFVKAANYGMADTKSAWFEIYLTDYSERDVTAPELAKKLEKNIGSAEGVSASSYSIDIGPPASNFEAQVQVGQGERREDAKRLADDIAGFLKTADIRRLDGSTVGFKGISVAGNDRYVRADGKQYIGVTASFVDDDTTTLITLTKAAVEKEFDAKKIASYGLDANALDFDFGQEQDSQDSFKALLLALPALLLVIYVILAIEFRSFLQPLLIFMAIPFSFFGITLGLYLTDNAFSFFAMLGFFALIGLSIKNTILLTDYANQAQAEGKSAVDAVHDALAERFRPLIATSLTAVVSLVPLALASPFWQALCVVLICGLLSSTFLVVTVFPYYYLGGEYLRRAGGRIIGYARAHSKDWL